MGAANIIKSIVLYCTVLYCLKNGIEYLALVTRFNLIMYTFLGVPGFSIFRRVSRKQHILRVQEQIQVREIT